MSIDKDSVKVAREICKIAECIFNEEIHMEVPISGYSQCYCVYKNNREIANVIKFYNGFAVFIPLFNDNTVFIRAITLAMPDIEVTGVPWIP